MQMFESLESRKLLSFSAPITTAGGGDSVVVANFNGDNYADVSVLVSGKVSVRLGNGDGTFGRGPTLSGVVGTATSITTGDFNNDGDADLRAYATSVAKKGGTVTYTANETTWLGTGEGTFGAPSVFSHQPYGPGIPPVYNPYSTYADFNGDTFTDIADLQARASGQISVYLNNGDDTYGSPVLYASGKDPSAINSGDFNGDGRIDLVVVNSLAKGKATLTVLLNDGSW